METVDNLFTNSLRGRLARKTPPASRTFRRDLLDTQDSGDQGSTSRKRDGIARSEKSIERHGEPPN